MDYALAALVIGIIGLSLRSSIMNDAYLPTAVVLAGLWLYMLLRSIVISWRVKRRTTKVRRGGLVPSMVSLFTASSIKTVGNNSGNPEQTFYIESDKDWSLYEFELTFMRRSKYGKYAGRQLYYTVLEVKINRPLPNIVFDSMRAKGRQFKYAYLQSQRLSLEGGFDDVFVTYAPDNYKIDTLSFVTPEVMAALLEARDFDIEIVGDRVFLYGPVLFDSTEAEQMKSLGQRLAVELNDNIDTYSDSYVAGMNKYTTTNAFARKLQKSPFKSLVAVGICLVIIAGLTVLSVINHENYLFREVSLYLVIFGALSGYSAFKINRDNRRLRQNFVADQNAQAYAQSRQY